MLFRNTKNQSIKLNTSRSSFFFSCSSSIQDLNVFVLRESWKTSDKRQVFTGWLLICWAHKQRHLMDTMKWLVSTDISTKDTRIEEKVKKRKKVSNTEWKREGKKKEYILQLSGLCMTTFIPSMREADFTHVLTLKCSSSPSQRESGRDRKWFLWYYSFFWRWKGERDCTGSPGHWLWFPAPATVSLSLP